MIGHREPQADAGDRGVDPDDPAPGVGERAAGVAGVQGRVGLDDVLDEPARPSVARRERPAKGAHDTGRDAAGEAERVADRDDQLPDPEPVGVTEWCGGQAAGGGTDHREVGERVPPDDLERQLRAVDEGGLTARPACDDVGRRQEVAVGVNATADPAPPPQPFDGRTRRLATEGMSRSAAPLTARE